MQEDDQSRTAYMLLGRRSIDEDDDSAHGKVGTESEFRHTPARATRITVGLLRKIIVPSEEVSSAEVESKVDNISNLAGRNSQVEAAAQAAEDDKFLKSKVVRLDSKNIKTIENLEMLEELTHLHLQNNLISRIEELDFLRKLQWLDLSRNKITSVTGIAHLRELQHLDLSCNNISTLNSDLKMVFPRISLRVLNLYGNPVAATEGYRTRITTAFPKLVAFDGTCLADNPEDAPIAPGGEIYGCDGDMCNARVIFGPRFVKRRSGDGAEEDYCIACAYRAVAAFKTAEKGKLTGHGYLLSSLLKASSATAAGEKVEDQEQGARFSSVEKYQQILGASARAARLSMRNARENIIRKARARRRTAVADAETRRFDLRTASAPASTAVASKK